MQLNMPVTIFHQIQENTYISANHTVIIKTEVKVRKEGNLVITHAKNLLRNVSYIRQIWKCSYSSLIHCYNLLSLNY